MIISLGDRLLDPSSSLPGSRWRAGPTRRAWTPKPPRSCSLFDLAPSGVYRARPVARPAGELLPHRFTLTLPSRCPPGGLLSVALSLASRPVGVTHHCVLRSPDFPPAGPSRGLSTPFVPCRRSSDRLPAPLYRKCRVAVITRRVSEGTPPSLTRRVMIRLAKSPAFLPVDAGNAQN